MVGIAISLLWLAIGVIILGAVIWILLSVIRRFIPLPPNVEYAIWAIFAILIFIYLLYAIEGGGTFHSLMLR